MIYKGIKMIHLFSRQTKISIVLSHIGINGMIFLKDGDKELSFVMPRETLEKLSNYLETAFFDYHITKNQGGKKQWEKSI